MKMYDKKIVDKDRLTITLPPDLTATLDKTIDGKEIRNRSHAIEIILRKSLKPVITNAVILAGESALNKTHPSLTVIDGRYLLDITLEHLAASGIQRVYLLAGSYTKKLQQALGSRTYSLSLHWLQEANPMGTGGALTLLKGVLTEPFLVINGDVLTNIPIQSFVDFHLSEKSLVTIAVKPRQSEPSFGRVTLEGNRIAAFMDHNHEAGISIINTGVYLMNPAVFLYFPKSKSFKIETDVFPKLAVAGELSAFFFQGMWFDVSTHKNMTEIINRYHLERK